jgi:uncharacterized protein YdiU (UPF0061 family)
MAKPAALRALHTDLYPSPQRAPHHRAAVEPYLAFSKINGSHPLQMILPEIVVPYKVRQIETAKVAYFNFDLAKEMGLIPNQHPQRLNKNLEATILSTFAIRIINEYDIKKKIPLETEKVKPNAFMATRYLQLQHTNKKGQTSGDGRSIWNGQLSHKGKVWDVSSRGTGVTCLAPGAVDAGRPLKTGGTQFGYGCGTADMEELIGSALMSEIFHNQGMKTERMLAIIDLGGGTGIGVRAAPNLLRPAHLFALLKQGRKDALKRGADYLIERQTKNREWSISIRSVDKYNKMLFDISRSFAEFVAWLEINYMFVWLDWDGDNVLSNAGIIDYGSVRQFGLCHNAYRYDDVDRFSTSLPEQKQKAREIVQVFAQMVHYLNTGRKLPVKRFKNKKSLRHFDVCFENARAHFFLWRMGFDEAQTNHLMRHNKKLIDQFTKQFEYFENKKTLKKFEKLPDGINKAPIFNMRNFLREYPELILENGFDLCPPEQIFQIMLSDTAGGRDAKFKTQYLKPIQNLQKLYMELLVSLPGDLDPQIHEITHRSSSINKISRITGNSIECVVGAMTEATKKGLNYAELQKVMETFIHSQHIIFKESNTSSPMLRLFSDERSKKLLDKTLKLVLEYSEDV